jgi:hypothetical protein
VVVEHMWTASPDLRDFYQRAWAGDRWPKRLAEVGIHAQLVTDDANVAAWADAAGMAEVWRLDPGAEERAATAAETRMARLFALAAECLEAWTQSSASHGELLWIHSQGWQSPWDAPLELRAALLDDEDPEAPAYVNPPARINAEDHDELLGLRAAYAAQTIVLDECVGGLLALLAELGLAESPHVALVGCRGYALGEHGCLIRESRSLYSELLHVPCLFWQRGSAPAPPRRGGLASVDDLQASLAAWFDRKGAGAAGCDGADCAADEKEEKKRSFVAALGDHGERAMRTCSWMLRLPPRPRGEDEAALPSLEVYVKPDDRWEANEVADRCGDVAERLLAALEQAGPLADGDISLDEDLA